MLYSIKNLKYVRSFGQVFEVDSIDGKTIKCHHVFDGPSNNAGKAYIRSKLGPNSLYGSAAETKTLVRSGYKFEGV